MPHATFKPRTLLAALSLVLIALLVSACDATDVSITPSAIIHFKAYYFQQFWVPSFNISTPPVCQVVPDPADQHWFVFVQVDGIDNSAAGSSDFTFDPANLKPKNTDVTPEYTWTGYLDSYWQPQTVKVPAGQKVDATQIHQGAFFSINFGQSTPASALSDYPPVLYYPTSPPGTLMNGDPHVVFSGSGQPTNVSLVSVHDVPLVLAGPCK